MDAKFLDCGPNLFLADDGGNGGDDGDGCRDAKFCVSTVALPSTVASISFLSIIIKVSLKSQRISFLIDYNLERYSI